MNSIKRWTRGIVFPMLLGCLMGISVVSAAQQTDSPQVENAQMQHRAVSGTLAATIRELEKSGAEAAGSAMP